MRKYWLVEIKEMTAPITQAIAAMMSAFLFTYSPARQGFNGRPKYNTILNINKTLKSLSP